MDGAWRPTFKRHPKTHRKHGAGRSLESLKLEAFLRTTVSNTRKKIAKILDGESNSIR